jgi:three-Cys-motif partner protein
MHKHEFGGEWTSEKLECLRNYLSTYRQIFSKNAAAQFFITNYVDAFAGTGYRSSAKSKTIQPLSLFPEEEEAQEVEEYTKGSVRIALDIKPPFHHYYFIDKNPHHIAELERLKQEYANLAPRIHIHRSDANIFIKEWCRKTDWSKNRAVVFLDPYGMQVDWNTIQTIAMTKAIDLWLLVPLGIGVNRLLTKDRKPSAEWSKTLTRFLGTEEWNDFYEEKRELTLFGDEIVSECKNADFDRIGNFIIKRLKLVFEDVAQEPLQLCNSRNNPIYLFCFAAGNKKGSPTAVKIAGDIMRKSQKRR